MPAFHGPLPPLEQEALLSVRLLHDGRKAPEPLNNLPAVLEGDTGAIVNDRVRNINITFKISYINTLLLNFRSPYTHTWLPSCLEELLLSLCVGEGDVILLQLDSFAPHSVLVSVETVESEITEDPQGALLGPQRLHRNKPHGRVKVD